MPRAELLGMVVASGSGAPRSRAHLGQRTAHALAQVSIRERVRERSIVRLLPQLEQPLHLVLEHPPVERPLAAGRLPPPLPEATEPAHVRLAQLD